MTIAIITARGGSTRLPRKNVREFCGHPLVAWAIVQALSSHLIDSVYVSTDDDEIEKISCSYGANVIRRPDWPDAHLCAANRPFIHAINELKKIYGDEFNEMVSILPTTPLVLPGELDNGIRKYRAIGADTMRPLRPLRELVVLKKTHPAKCRCDIFDKKYGYLGESNAWVVCSPEWYVGFNSEISDIDSVLDNMENWPARESYFIPAEYWQYADVDTAEEFEYAEILMEHYILKGRGMEVYSEYALTKPEIENASDKGILKYFGNRAQQFNGD